MFRDFPYKCIHIHYASANIEEKDILKFILKNINPQLANQLRSSRVTSANGPVCPGQKREKDQESQLQYYPKGKPGFVFLNDTST